MKRDDLKRILIIGAGPIVIGQGCEFDYSGVQAVKALKKEGYEVVLVNSNPATVMTDPDRADRTYIEPLTVDSLHEIIRRERPDAVLPTLGGQTALNLAMELDRTGILRRYRVELIGAQAEAIARAEDRQLFKAAMKELGLLENGRLPDETNLKIAIGWFFDAYHAVLKAYARVLFAIRAA